MKKVLLFSAMISLLSACGSEPKKESLEDENSLPPGIMQPIESTGAVEGGLEPEIQKQSMPTGM